MADAQTAQSRCRVELRAKYDSGRIVPLYDWYATCSCGWRGPERAHEVDATGDGHEHAPAFGTAEMAAIPTCGYEHHAQPCESCWEDSHAA